MDPKASPVQDNPRRVLNPIKDEVKCKSKISELEASSVIASMVVVWKPNQLTLCLDPLHLNKGIISRKPHNPQSQQLTLYTAKQTQDTDH